MPEIKLQKRLTNLMPAEEQILAEMLCEAYTKGIENGKPKWIPVTERLPEYFGTFIVVITDTDGVHTDAADFDPFEKKWLPSACYSKYYKVTHWMPLPTPPKGE